MTHTVFLSRARLRRDAPIQALARVLVPEDPSKRVATTHRLVWTLFADSAERERDFLWREAEPGLYYLLSSRAPVDHHGLFDLDPPKPFTPSLAAGDRLSFTLRANATVARGGGPGKRGKPCDVVMAELHAMPPGARAEHRADVIQKAGLNWLDKQGVKSGFKIDRSGDGEASARVLSYSTHALDRRGGDMRIGVLEFEGTLTVTDPPRFLDALTTGFGRAKAFGCGLMLIRRA